MEKHLNIDDVIDMYIDMSPVDINFKDALLTSLYSQIEFLKTELEEKKLFIRTLLLRENEVYKYSPTRSPMVNESTHTIPKKLVDYDETLDDESIILNSTLYNSATSETTNMYNNITSSITSHHATSTLSSSNNGENGRYKYSNLFTWEKHSSGVASKILNRMGYKGKGLGKAEDGIREPITIKSSNRIGTASRRENKDPPKRKVFYILSDSMLNGIEGKTKVLK